MSNLSAMAIKQVSTGQYAGNSVQNRTIPHGLKGNKTPAIVILTDDLGVNYIMHNTTLTMIAAAAVVNGAAQTAIDATNFYPGTANPQYYGNLTGRTYDWIAIAT